MLEVDLGGAEAGRLPRLEVHLFGAADEPGVVEGAGVAEVEAALLFGERGDVWAGDDGETDESEEAGRLLRELLSGVARRRGRR